MGFGKGLRSKMEKMFSSPSNDPEVVNDPPPPYILPPEFVEAGIKEDDLAILRDYDTIIILDDSGSMQPLWDQVSDISSPPKIESIPDPRRLLSQARRALSALAVVASRYDTDGIDIRFLNHNNGVSHKAKVNRLTVRPYHLRIDNDIDVVRLHFSGRTRCGTVVL